MRSRWVALVLSALLLAGCQGTVPADPTPTDSTTTASSTTDAPPCGPYYREAVWGDPGLRYDLFAAHHDDWQVASTRPAGNLSLPTDEANETLFDAVPVQAFLGPFRGAGVLPRLGVFLLPGPTMQARFVDDRNVADQDSISELLERFLVATTDLTGPEVNDLVFATSTDPQPGPVVEGVRTLVYESPLNETRLRLDAWYDANRIDRAWQAERGTSWAFAKRTENATGFQRDTETPMVWGAQYIQFQVEAVSVDGAALRVMAGDPDVAVYVSPDQHPSHVSLREEIRGAYRQLGLGLLPEIEARQESTCSSQEIVVSADGG